MWLDQLCSDNNLTLRQPADVWRCVISQCHAVVITADYVITMTTSTHVQHSHTTDQRAYCTILLHCTAFSMSSSTINQDQNMFEVRQKVSQHLGM